MGSRESLRFRSEDRRAWSIFPSEARCDSRVWGFPRARPIGSGPEFA